MVLLKQMKSLDARSSRKSSIKTRRALASVLCPEYYDILLFHVSSLMVNAQAILANYFLVTKSQNLTVALHQEPPKHDDSGCRSHSFLLPWKSHRKWTDRSKMVLQPLQVCTALLHDQKIYVLILMAGQCLGYLSLARSQCGTLSQQRPIMTCGSTCGTHITNNMLRYLRKTELLGFWRQGIVHGSWITSHISTNRRIPSGNRTTSTHPPT